jgi:hypothetical protein
VLHSSLAPDVQLPKRAVVDTQNERATHEVIITSSTTVALAKIMFEVSVENRHFYVPLHSVSIHYNRHKWKYTARIDGQTRSCGAPHIAFEVEGKFYQETEVTITGTTSAVYEVDACDIECPAIIFVFIPQKNSLHHSKVKLISNHFFGIQCM